MKLSRTLIPVAMAILSLHLAPAAALGASQQLDIWTWRNPVPTGNQLYGVTHGQITGNTLWVAVGANSTILTSQDGGNTWGLQAAPQPIANLSGIAYSPNGGVLANHFVAVGSSAVNGNDVILFSPDGTNWMAATGLGPDGYGGLFAVAYGGSYFMTVGFDGYYYYSTDGKNWTAGAINLWAGDANGVAYGSIGGLNGFVVVGDEGQIFSTTLIGLGNWTDQTAIHPSTSTLLTGITYNSVNGFVAVGYGVILNSPDGVNWYDTTGPSGYGAAVFGDNQFVAVANTTPDLIYTSTGSATSTPDTWNTTSTSQPFDAIEFDGVSTFVAVGPNGTIATSTTGTSWMPHNSSVTLNPLNAITYGASSAGVSLFMAGGTNINGGPGIFTSSDGYTWNTGPSLNSLVLSFGSMSYGYINGLAYGNISGTPEFVALVNISADNPAFGGSVIISSSDANAWSVDYEINVFNILNGVAYGFNGPSPSGQPVFVAVGNEGAAVWSGNPSTWTRGTGLNTAFNYNAVAYGNVNGTTPTFVTVGQAVTQPYTGSGQNFYYSTSGGNSWTAATTGPPSKYHAYNGVAYGNGIFVTVGVTNGVYPPVGVIYDSFDGGKNWTQIPPAFFTTPPAPFSSVTFANGFFVAATSGGNIWVSPDGANWTQTSIVASGSLHAVASGDYQYIAVGDGGAILGSVLEAVSGGTFLSSGGGSGIFSFTANGPPGMQYGVYVSNDLVIWTWLKNVIIPAGATSVSVNALTSANYTQGYYSLGPPGP